MTDSKPVHIKADPAILQPYYEVARSLTLWNKPAHSGVSVLVLLAGILVARWFSGDLVRVSLGLLTLATGLSLAYAAVGKIAAMVTGSATLPDPHALVAHRTRLAVSEADALHLASVAVTVINTTLAWVVSVVLVEDLSQSAVGFVILYLAWTLSSWLAVTSLAGLAVVAAFAGPIAYDRNREVIEVQRAVVLDLANQKLGFILERSRTIRADLTAKLATPAAAAAASAAVAQPVVDIQHPKEE